MSGRRKCDVLLVGQTPPPFHGQAVVTAMLFDHDWEDLQVETLRMAFSDSLDAVGKASLGKVFHLIGLVLRTWWVALRHRPRALYYLPASANRVPVLRDIFYLALVRWCFRKKVFHYHAGGLPEYLAGAGLIGKLGRWAYRGADTSVEICETELPPAGAFGARRQVIVPNGLDVEDLAAARSADGAVRLLFVGGLNEGKGVLEILRTARALLDRGCDSFEIVFAGAWASGEFEREVGEFVCAHGLSDRVNFAGVLKGDDKWQAYADADVFFFPSHYQSENFPLVVIEAMACRLPVISTKWRGIPQLVGDSGGAILCDVRATDQFADAAESLIADPALRADMGERARQRYEGRFTRARFVESMGEVFKEVCR